MDYIKSLSGIVGFSFSHQLKGLSTEEENDSVHSFSKTQIAIGNKTHTITSILNDENHLVTKRTSKNFIKAIKEHSSSSHTISTPEEAGPPSTTLLDFEVSASEIRGKRPLMEDVSAIIPTPYGLLFGCFDGHADRGHIADFARKQLSALFVQTLEQYPTDIYKTFHEIINTIHKNIPSSNQGGSVLAFSFIPNGTNQIITATLGDCEAKIYRKSAHSYRCIPISCVRNWASSKDSGRVFKLLEEAKLLPPMAKTAAEWIKLHEHNGKIEPKKMRICGLNAARTVGDITCAINDTIAVSQKPKVTSHFLNPGDIVIVGSDGGWDFLSDEEIINIIEKPSSSLSNALVAQAEKKSNDNISFIVVQVKALSGSKPSINFVEDTTIHSGEPIKTALTRLCFYSELIEELVESCLKEALEKNSEEETKGIYALRKVGLGDDYGIYLLSKEQPQIVKHTLTYIPKKLTSSSKETLFSSLEELQNILATMAPGYTPWNKYFF